MNKSSALLQHIFLNCSELAPGWSSLSGNSPEHRFVWALIGRAILDYCCTREGTPDWLTANDFLFQEDSKGPETFYDWLSYVHDRPDALIERLRNQLKNDQSLKQSLRSAHIFGYRDSLVRQGYKRKFA